MRFILEGVCTAGSSTAASGGEGSDSSGMMDERPIGTMEALGANIVILDMEPGEA